MHQGRENKEFKEGKTKNSNQVYISWKLTLCHILRVARKLLKYIHYIVQSGEAVEYTDCTSEEG